MIEFEWRLLLVCTNPKRPVYMLDNLQTARFSLYMCCTREAAIRPTLDLSAKTWKNQCIRIADSKKYTFTHKTCMEEEGRQRKVR